MQAGRASRHRLRESHTQRVIDQPLYGSEEPHRVWKRRVQFEGSTVAPAGVNVELATHANGLEGLVAEAARLELGRALDCPDCLAQRCLATCASVETREEEELHDRTMTSRQRALHTAPWQLSALKSYTAECPGLPCGVGTPLRIMNVAEFPP